MANSPLSPLASGDSMVLPQAEPRLFSTPVKWCLLLALLGLNFLFLFFFDRLVPDEMTKRLLFYRLLPAYLPAWLSVFLWILATGAVVEFFSLQRPVRNFLQWVFSGVFAHPVFRKKLDFLPTNPSLAVRGLTVVVAAVYLIVELSLISRLARLFVWSLCMLANFIIWFVFYFYFEPLCHYFQYGDTTWHLILFCTLTFLVGLSVFLYLFRIKRLSYRKTLSWEMLIVPLVPLAIWIAWGYLPAFITAPDYRYLPDAICFLPCYFPGWYAPMLWTVTIAAYLEIATRRDNFRWGVRKWLPLSLQDFWLALLAPDRFLKVLRYATFFLLAGILIYQAIAGTLIIRLSHDLS